MKINFFLPTALISGLCLLGLLVSQPALASDPCETPDSSTAATQSDCELYASDNLSCIDAACDSETDPASCRSMAVVTYNSAMEDCAQLPVPTLSGISTTTPAASLLPSFTYSIVPVTCQNKTGGCNLCDIGIIIINAANIMAALLSAIALLMFILGGFFWIISDGNEQRIETGKKILMGTVMGLGVIFLAWFAVNIIVRYAYQSSVGTESTATGAAKIFDKDWWATLSNCNPSSTPCVGKYIGDACGGGGCKTGTEGCACYRPVNPKGDNRQCGGGDEDVKVDATLQQVESYTTGSDQCYCAIGCDLFELNKASATGSYANYTWSCVSDITIQANNIGRSGTDLLPGYNNVYVSAPVDVTCAESGTSCVGQKK